MGASANADAVCGPRLAARDSARDVSFCYSRLAETHGPPQGLGVRYLTGDVRGHE